MYLLNNGLYAASQNDHIYYVSVIKFLLVYSLPHATNLK